MATLIVVFLIDQDYYTYGTPQSKQSKTPERWRNFFLRPPLKIAQKCLSLQFFLHIPINHDVKASEKI